MPAIPHVGFDACAEGCSRSAVRTGIVSRVTPHPIAMSPTIRMLSSVYVPQIAVAPVGPRFRVGVRLNHAVIGRFDRRS